MSQWPCTDSSASRDHLPSRSHRVLQSLRRHRLGRARHPYSRAWVDDRYSTGRGGLMQLEWRRLALQGNVWSRVRIEGKGVGCDLVGLWRMFGTAARQWRAIRRRGVIGMHVGIGEECWTEFGIILQVEGSTCFEALAEVGNGYSLFLFSDIPILFVVLRQSRRPTPTTAVMRTRLYICWSRMLVSVVVVVRRHYRLIDGRLLLQSKWNDGWWLGVGKCRCSAFVNRECIREG